MTAKQLQDFTQPAILVANLRVVEAGDDIGAWEASPVDVLVFGLEPKTHAGGSEILDTTREHSPALAPWRYVRGMGFVQINEQEERVLRECRTSQPFG